MGWESRLRRQIEIMGVDEITAVLRTSEGYRGGNWDPVTTKSAARRLRYADAGGIVPTPVATWEGLCGEYGAARQPDGHDMGPEWRIDGLFGGTGWDDDFFFACDASQHWGGK